VFINKQAILIIHGQEPIFSINFVRMVSQEFFSDYLKASLPEEYPKGTVSLSFHMRDTEAKEFIYQQAQILERAKGFLPEAPYVAYIAALKHAALLSIVKIDTASFGQISDKEYFDRVNRDYEDLAEAAKSQLDETTEWNCSELVALQCVAAKLSGAINILKQAISLGFSAFNEEPPEPQVSPSDFGCMIFIVAIVGICVSLFVGVQVNAMMGISLFLMALAIIIGAINFLNKKATPQQKRFEAFFDLRSRFEKDVEGILPLLYDNQSVVFEDLEGGLELLEGLQNSRTESEEAYLKDLYVLRGPHMTSGLEL
jgi:hypothetical protein